MMHCEQVFWFDLYVNGEHIQLGKKPCIVLGCKENLLFSNCITIIPFTSRINSKKHIPSHVLINNTPKIALYWLNKSKPLIKSE